MSKENFDYYLKLIKNTLTQRGTQYDNAFHKTWDEWGLDASRLVLTFKLNRLKNIEYNENNLSAIRDTSNRYRRLLYSFTYRNRSRRINLSLAGVQSQYQ